MNRYRIIFEDAGWRNLLPLTYWRSVGELRCGRRMLLEQHLPARPADGATPHLRAMPLDEPAGLWVRPELADVLAERFAGPVAINQHAPPDADAVLLINARWLAEAAPPAQGPPAVGVCEGQVAYLRLSGGQAEGRSLSPGDLLADEARSADDWAARLGRREQADGRMIDYPWDIVHANPRRLLADWQAGGGPNLLGTIYDGVHLLDRRSIHVGAGSTVKPCTVLDAEAGPIWIGQNVRVSPHCTIQGPVAICDGALIQPGSVIRDGATIGPVCKVGGEIEGSVLWGFSNKQHDGFLGHAALGAWINIAADSVNSDLKNTYGPIRVPINGVEVDSGQMFVGLTMGDHAKSSINSSFATGTVVGFCSNVICNLFPPKFVPSFCWLTDDGRQVYDVEKGLSVARAVMARRKVELSPAEADLFRAISRLCRQIEQAGPLDKAEV